MSDTRILFCGFIKFFIGSIILYKQCIERKKKRYCVALLMPFFCWNGHLNKTKFKLNEKRSVGRDGGGGNAALVSTADKQVQIRPSAVACHTLRGGDFE